MMPRAQQPRVVESALRHLVPEWARRQAEIHIEACEMPMGGAGISLHVIRLRRATFDVTEKALHACRNDGDALIDMLRDKLLYALAQCGLSRFERRTLWVDTKAGRRAWWYLAPRREAMLE